MITVFVVISFFIGLLFVFQSTGRFFYNYKITGASILLCFFGAVVFKEISIDDIVEIRKVNFKYLFFEALESSLQMGSNKLFFFNRIFGDYLLIRRNSGTITLFFITPDNTNKFIAKVMRIKKNLK